MRAPDGNYYHTATAADSTAFNLSYGGHYKMAVVATFGGGSIELQVLGPDKSTYVSLLREYDNAGSADELPVGKMSANGSKSLFLAPGTYKWVVTTATAVYASLTRVPGE